MRRQWYQLTLVAMFAVTWQIHASEVKSKSHPGDKKWHERKSIVLKELGEIPGNPDVDKYGGLLKIKAPATGFFHTIKINDRWWLVDPDGGLFISVGVTSVKTDDSEADNTIKLLKEYGFNSVGAWSDIHALSKAQDKITYTTIWHFMSSYRNSKHISGHELPIFDPEFESFCMEYAKQLLATKDDPWLLGHFSDNELSFFDTLLDDYLKLPETDPNHIAAMKWLAARNHNTISDAVRKEFVGYAAENYFRITTQAIRKYDPNHLCLGSRYHGRVKHYESMWIAGGKYLDVISVNCYGIWTPEHVDKWVAAANKPILVSEFYVKGMDSGMSNHSGAGWCVMTQHDRGLFYQNFTIALLKSKGCVGWHWFKYANGGDSNQGIVNAQRERYLPLLNMMNDLNRHIYSIIRFTDNATMP